MLHRIAIGIAALLAFASARAGSEAELPLDAHARLFDGNASQIETFERCAVDNALCALTLARWHRERDRPDQAAEHLRRAVEIGHAHAPLALAFLHSETGESAAAWAWAYLAWKIDDPDGSLSDAETRDLFSYRLLATHQASLDEDGRERAEALANQLLAAHFERLQLSVGRARESESALEPLRRTPPDYPLALARRGVEGFAIVYAEVGANGRIVEAVPVYASHGPFGPASARAVRKWRFKRIADSSYNQDDNQADAPVGLEQVIQYQLR